MILEGRHGFGPYTHGCRCEVCREAKRQYEQKRRRSANLDALTHGLKSTYDCGCRCLLCRREKKRADYLDWTRHREARLEYQRKWRANRKAGAV